MSSPDYDPGDYDRSENDERGSGPLSSPDEMSLDSAYQYQGHTPNPRQTFAQNYNGNNQSYGQPVSNNSPTYGPGFVPINQNFGAHQAVPILSQSHRPYNVPSLGTDPVRIPQAGFSPSNNDNPNAFASFFTGQEQVFMGDISNQFGNQDPGNWLDLYIPTNLSWDSAGGTFNDQFDMQPVYSSQSAEAPPFEQRRGSIFYPTVRLQGNKLMKARNPCRRAPQRWS
jgi:hypothetical protein